MIPFSPTELTLARRTTAGNRPSTCKVYRQGRQKTPDGGFRDTGSPTLIASSGLRVSAGSDATGDVVEAGRQLGRQTFLLALDPLIDARIRDYVVEDVTNRRFEVVTVPDPTTYQVETHVLGWESK